MCDIKKDYGAILILSILFNKSFFFSVKCFETWCIYGFSGSASLLAYTVFMCDRKQSCEGHAHTLTICMCQNLVPGVTPANELQKNSQCLLALAQFTELE